MADEIRIIHTGDTHLGYRQYHSEERRQDFMGAFGTVIDDAIEMQVDAVIHAGDLFDSRNPTLEDILETMQLFSRLKEAGIPLLAIVGNHESKQNTQWLDLYGSMGLVTRLGATPYILKNIAIYGIDSVSKSRIPLFDYSVFQDTATDSDHNILVMHQMMKPFPFGEWDVKEVLDALPFNVDVVLLGDNHKHEITKVDDTWVTYCGSTERNSGAEKEPRSYNIITVSDSSVDISKRIIPTREFLFIAVHLSKGSDGYDETFSAIKEHDVDGKVVFVNISGDPEVKVKLSDIEDFLLSRRALVPVIKDIRMGEGSLLDPSLKISFADPDDVVREEIRKMRFTDGGLLLDEVIRDAKVPKTRVDDEVEQIISSHVSEMDFSRDLPHQQQVPDSRENHVDSPSPETEGSVPDSDDTSYELEPELASPDEVISDRSYDAKKAGEPGNDPDSNDGFMEADSAHSTEGQDSEQEHDPDEAAVKPRQYNLGDYL